MHQRHYDLFWVGYIMHQTPWFILGRLYYEPEAPRFILGQLCYAPEMPRFILGQLYYAPEAPQLIPIGSSVQSDIIQDSSLAIILISAPIPSGTHARYLMETNALVNTQETVYNYGCIPSYMTTRYMI